MDNWVFVPPFLAVIVLLVLFGWTVWGELQARWAGRHRGVYAPQPEWSEPVREYYIWSGEVRIAEQPGPEMGVAFITICPDSGVMTIPVLRGEPGLAT